VIEVAALTAILQRHDPSHIAWMRHDEYAIEASAIIERLTDEMELPELAALVHAVCVQMIDDDPEYPVPPADDAVWREIAGKMLGEG
jgi:hypothetical protein